MKHLLITLLVAILSIGFGAPDAEAKRLGGGSSLGMQRQTTPPPAPSAPQQNLSRPQQNATPPASQPQPRRNWLGPIAGLAAGLGLAALFSHLGLGEELASFVMLALLIAAAMLVFRMLFRRNAGQQHGMHYADAAHGSAATPVTSAAATPFGSTQPASGTPDGFDAAAFVRQAKVNFIRLQAANDAGNLDDIREFTSPEMFAEIKMQLAERNPGGQQTDVVQLDAEVLDVVEEAHRYIVSVRFHGLIREEHDAAPIAFDEVWHLTKPLSGSAGWVIAGIQQLN